MSLPAYNENTACRSIEPLLAEYQENALSARQVWEVEKHLTVCAACTQLWQQMQATVQALQSAERYDTGDDFMARLHARLDTLEPEMVSGRSHKETAQADRNGTMPHRRSLKEATQDWLTGLRLGLRAWQFPALTAGFAAATLVLMAYGNFSIAPAAHTTPPAVAHTAAPVLSQQVAFVASNPFDDPVAAKAEVDGAVSENHPDNSATSNY